MFWFTRLPMYGTGMGVSEVVHLGVRHIHSQRMMIRIEQSKGNRDRDVPLSSKLLEPFKPEALLDAVRAVVAKSKFEKR